MNFTGEKPIYLEIAEQLEDEIFVGHYPEGSQIPSTTELSVSLQINPATVLKGMNILVDEDIIFKKRGLGMFVKDGAVKRITAKRKNNFCSLYIKPMLAEASKLKMSEEDLINLIKGDKNG